MLTTRAEGSGRRLPGAVWGRYRQLRSLMEGRPGARRRPLSPVTSSFARCLSGCPASSQHRVRTDSRHLSTLSTQTFTNSDSGRTACFGKTNLWRRGKPQESGCPRRVRAEAAGNGRGRTSWGDGPSSAFSGVWIKQVCAYVETQPRSPRDVSTSAEFKLCLERKYN